MAGDATLGAPRREYRVTYQFDFAVVLENAGALFYGCLETLMLSGIAMLVALIAAVLAVLGLRLYPRVLRAPIGAFVEVVRNTPFLIQIFFIYFGLPALGVRLPPDPAAVVALAINGAAYAIEIIRAGVESIGSGQIEAGQALGLSSAQIFRGIVLRPALRAVYPALTSQFIFLMLTSSIASSISARELTHVAAILEGISFRSFEVYFTVTILYGVMSLLLSVLFSLLFRYRISYPTR
jgi:polar amino acid transport system permease protein